MSLLGLVRDKSRDMLTEMINSFGVKAHMSERGRPEEKIHKPLWMRSLGIIDVPEGPVRWINIFKKDGSRHSPPAWHVIFGIPDERVTGSQGGLEIKTIRQKAFPVFGKVVGVDWKGDDLGTGLASVLANDASVAALVAKTGNLRVKGFDEGWTIRLDRRIHPKPTWWAWGNRAVRLAGQDWETLQKIADLILSSPRVSSG